MAKKYETILLTDPTGTVGNAVIERLASLGQNIIRVAVDIKNNVSKIKHADEIAIIDNTKPETIADALNNVDRLFLRIPPTIDMVSISSNFIKEAKKNGVKFIVKLSAIGADLEPGYLGGRSHREVEQIIEESEIPYAFLRPNSFMQNFITRFSQTVKNQNAICLPAGDAKISFLDARDIAAIAAEVLTRNGSHHLNKVYEITGPEALSHDQVAEILSMETGRRIAYIDISEGELYEGLKQLGIADWFIDNALGLYDMYRSGQRSRETTVIEQITGQKPTSFSQFASNYFQNGLSWPNQLSTVTGWLKFE